MSKKRLLVDCKFLRPLIRRSHYVCHREQEEARGAAAATFLMPSRGTGGQGHHRRRLPVRFRVAEAGPARAAGMWCRRNPSHGAQGDPVEISKQKVMLAAAQVDGPALVDDTSLCYTALRDMPGTCAHHNAAASICRFRHVRHNARIQARTSSTSLRPWVQRGCIGCCTASTTSARTHRPSLHSRSAPRTPRLCLLDARRARSRCAIPTRLAHHHRSYRLAARATLAGIL